MATISERLAYVLTFDTSSGVKSLNKLGATADKELGKAEKKLDKMSAGMTKFGAGAVAFAGLAGAGLVKVAMGASDLEESVNAVSVTFGEAGEGILKLGRDAAQAVGLSNVEFNGLAVQFSSFAQKVAGEGGDVVQTMADMTGRAADFASVMNMDVAQAATIFQSGLAGETEPLKKFGIDLSAAAVGAYAVAAGISESAASMSESDKVLARYELLMEQTAKTAGDFANTADGMANQQRVLKAEFKNLSDGIGAGVLPMLTKVVGVAGKTVGAFSRLSPEVQGTIGKFAALGVAGTGLIGTMSFVSGQAIKMRGNFTTLGADGSRSLTKMGKAAKGVGVAMGVAAVAMALYALEARGAARNTARFDESLGSMTETDFTDIEAGSAAINEFLIAMANDKTVENHAEAWEKLAREQPAAAAAIAATTEGTLLSAQGLAELDEAIAKVADGEAQAIINEKNYAEQQAATNDVTEDATESAEDLADAVAETSAAYYAAVEATEALTAAQIDAIPGVFDLELAQINLAMSVENYRQGQIDATAVLNDSNATDAEKTEALRKIRVEQIGLAQDLYATTVEYANQQGATEGSTEAAQFQLEELLRLREEYPELAGDIDVYIAALTDVPDVVSTEIQTLIDEENFALAESLLNNVARRRTMHVDVIANNRSAAVGQTPGNMPATDFSLNAPDFGSAFFGASGGLVTRPTQAVLGESGPEIVLPVNRGALSGAPGAAPLSSVLGGVSPADVASIAAAVEQGMIQGFRGIRQNERAA